MLTDTEQKYMTKKFKSHSSSLSGLNTNRWGHGCGVTYARDGSGNKELVVAGDLKGQDATVEVYSFADQYWRSGNIDLKVQNFENLCNFEIFISANDLPRGIYNAESVPFGDSFLLVGGYDSFEFELLDTFLQYIPANDSWVEMPAKLRTPRADHVVIPVKRSIFPSC